MHGAVPQPGRLLQQPYIESIGVTPRASGACMMQSMKRYTQQYKNVYETVATMVGGKNNRKSFQTNIVIILGK